MYFLGNNSTWDKFVHTEAVVWEQTVLGWLVNNMNRPILVTKYEDFKLNTKEEMQRILDFLQVPYSRQQLNKVLVEGYNEYRRPRGVEFEHYTESQKKFVMDIVRRTSDAISGFNYVEITDYLES